MDTNATILIAVLAFAVGVFVGQRMAHITGGVKFSFSDAPLSSSGLAIKTNKSINLTLKCTCGAVHNFHKGAGLAKPGSESYPEGDSYTCSTCGKVLDLQAIRKAAGEAGAQF